MATIIPGYSTEQVVSTIANNDTAMNTEIASKAVDGWIAASLTLSGANVIILFTRTIPA